MVLKVHSRPNVTSRVNHSPIFLSLTSISTFVFALIRPTFMAAQQYQNGGYNYFSNSSVMAPRTALAAN